MGRGVLRALAAAGWVLLGGVALLGVALSAVALLAALPFARATVASAVVRVIDDALAGGVELEGVEVLPGGVIELRELRVTDPHGHLVLAVGRARLAVDVTALRARIVGFEVELDAPSVLLEEEEGGGISLARAFAPSRPAPPGARREGADEGAGWTVHLSRVDIRRGDVWWVDAAGGTRVDAAALDVEARGTIGPRRLRAEVRLDGELRDPIASPLALELVAVRNGDAVRVPVLRLEANGTSLAALAEGDLARRRGRLAVTHLGLAREQARALLPSTPEGADLGATGFAESDGVTLSAAVSVTPAGGGGAGGRGSAAVAARLDALRQAVGFDVALERLDPARLAAGAPPGELTLTARGAAAGSSIDDARARLALTLSRSRLRRGEVTRAEVRLRAARGTLELERLSASAPGLVLSGSGRWRRGGEVAGTARAEADDLAVAARNLARLLGGAAPELGGRARLDAQLSGTSDAPALVGTLEASSLLAGDVVAAGVRLAIRSAGPLRAIEGSAEGSVGQLRQAGGRELARRIALRVALQRGGEGTLSATAEVPGAGSEPLSVDARGRLGPRQETLLLRQLALGWPGSRWNLARPAAIDLRGPSVDLLELVSDPQRIAIAGGIGRRGALDARAELSRVDLARLPPGVLPAEDEIRGELSGSLEATGTAAHPTLSARAALSGGAWRGLSGLAAQGEGRLDGVARRAVASLSAARGEGGTVDLGLDLPVPLAGRGTEPIQLRVRAAALPVAELLRAARTPGMPAAGLLAVDATVGGTAGDPSLAGEVALEGGAWEDLDEIGATVALQAGDGVLRATAAASLAGRDVLAAEGEVPLDLAELAARPEKTLSDLRSAPLRASARVTSLDLAALAGRAGVPQGVAGIVDAHAEVSGTAAAPRALATVGVARGAYARWRGLDGRIELAAGAEGLSASGTVAVAGAEALRLKASLGVAPERLGRREALLAAPLRVEAVIPPVALSPVAGDGLPVAGTLEGHLTAAGTPRAPEVTAEIRGSGVTIEGRPLGDASVAGRYAAGRAFGEVLLRPSAGGWLRATLALEADLGLGTDAAKLREAPAEVTASSEALDLGFLPALAPSLIRSAGGQLAVDLRARGPLARLSPRGTLRVDGGRLAVAEMGEWSDVALDVRVTDDLVELARLEVRRGKGRLSASGALRGARSETAQLTGKLTTEGFSVARAGMELATFDLTADAEGTWKRGELGVEVRIPRGVVRLPRKSPRELQALERRKDIQVGRREEKKKQEGPADEPERDGFVLHVHLVVPRQFFVKSDNPRADVELKADVRYERAGGQDYAEGTVEVVRGGVEPIAGRNFVIDRGRVQFTGGPPRAALLDIEAKYQNPAAVVTVNVSGPATSPEIRLTSQPPMDEAQIAMLIATGRTELKAGTGAVGTMTGEEAGRAALGAVATQAFRNLVQDKLPLDSVALDSGALRAGKYLTDKIHVAYVRRFDVDPTRGENEDEVRVEYQITPRWMFESRYGTAQAGGASLIWSRDY